MLLIDAITAAEAAIAAQGGTGTAKTNAHAKLDAATLAAASADTDDAAAVAAVNNSLDILSATALGAKLPV